MKRIIILILTGLILLAAGSATAEDQPKPSFQVIINAANPTEQLTKQEVSRRLLKKVTKWEHNGKAVVPVDLPEKSETRIAFTTAIHEKDVEAITAYWQNKIFSGRGVPPLQKTTDAEVLEFISNDEGAIGYVSGATTDFEKYKVKFLNIVEK